MKRYTPIEQVYAAKITAMVPLTERHGGGWEITLEDGTQVYENYADFQHARAGDVYIRPAPNQFNPLPKGYYLGASYFACFYREALPPLEKNHVPVERIEAMLATLTVQCQRFPGTTTTIALAALPGGFVVGEGMSACLDPAEFDARHCVQMATGRAMANARTKLMELESYFLMRMREQIGIASKGPN